MFQNPYESLNPRRRSGRDQLAARGCCAASAARGEAGGGAAARAGAPAGGTADRFPRELSGGERQRIAIARAPRSAPDLIVCDEVTSALDVSVQGAVLELLADLRRELGVSLLFISHDLGIVASIADRVIVLDRGLICEEGAVRSVLSSPRSDYTRRLVAAAPSIAAPAVL